jgi:hypothetical protein
MYRSLFVNTLCSALFGLANLSAQEAVSLVRTPNRGIQPQTLVDGKGRLHLLYFQGEAKAGDLMYVRRESGAATFSAPIRVNSQPGSAVAVGSIRGGHLAVGKDGRVHVVWFGSQQALPKNPIAGAPLLYARLDAAGKAFETQRNLMTKTFVLDGGGSLVADARGNVIVAWHAQPPGGKGEDTRQLWVSLSHDEGKTFAAEKPAWSEKTGACSCCGVRGFVDRGGVAYFTYRAATDKTGRGMYLLCSGDVGESFTGKALDEWRLDTCPMSSEAIAEGPGGVYVAWDNDGQIFFTRTPSTGLSVDAPKPAPGPGSNRKHPALAVNERGEMLLVWTEGTGWNRGGALAWQLYDKAGNPMGEVGRRPNAIPAWSLPAAIVDAKGNFTIIH